MKTILVLSVFAVIVLVFFQDVLIGPDLFISTDPELYEPWQAYSSDGSPARKNFFYDPFLAYLPRRVFLNESLRSGRFPLWNPYIFGGTPFFADVQTRVLYPPELLLVSLPPERAMGYDMAIHVFLAMLGMYLFLRTVKVVRPGALLGGFAYAFSSFFYFRYAFPTLAASAAWIPFFFYAFEVALKSRRKGTLLLAGAFSMGYLAGFPQVFLFGVGAVVFYGLFVGLSRPPASRASSVLETAKIFGTAGGLSMLLVSVQLVPFIELYRNSLGFNYPAEYVLTVFVAPPIILLRSIFPGFFGSPIEGTDWSDLPRALIHPYKPDFAVYIGIGALILALVSLSALRRSPRIGLLLVMLLASVGVAVSRHLLWIGYMLLPVFRASRADRISVLACFALSAMSGIGFSLIARDRANLRRFLLVILIIVVGFSLASVIAFELAGKSVIAGLAGKVRAMPDEFWTDNFGVTRSYRLPDWAGSDVAEWEAYQKGQLRRGLLLVILSSALIFSWVWLGPNRSKLKSSIGIAVVFLVIADLGTTAAKYYVTQTPESIRQTEGIRMLKYAIGRQGRWRTRTLRRTADTMAAFPCNTNMLFGVHSVDGQSTVRPMGYAVLKQKRDFMESEGDQQLSARNWIGGELDDLMGARFLIARTSDSRFESMPVFRSIALAGDPPGRLGILSVGDDARLALRQAPGDTFEFDVSLAPARALDFDVGFTSGGALAGDSIFFTLEIRGGTDAVHYRRGFDLLASGGRWHSGSIGLSRVRGGSAHVVASVSHTGAGRACEIRAGWSRFEFPMRDCSVRPTADGYEIAIGRRGAVLSFDIRSEAGEVPLDVRFDDGRPEIRHIAFLPDTRSRWITIDLKKKKATRVVLRSDSTFSIGRCRQVWRGWASDFDCRLIYDGDMCIYENTRALERGILVRREAATSADSDVPVLPPSSLENVASLECGTCSVVSYAPERVVLEVDADQDGYVIFQDIYYPGWKAYVDGTETDIRMTNLGVRAIEVSSGQHRIEMVFKPLSFKLGLLLTCVGLALTIYRISGRTRESP